MRSCICTACSTLIVPVHQFTRLIILHNNTRLVVCPTIHNGQAEDGRSAIRRLKSEDRRLTWLTGPASHTSLADRTPVLLLNAHLIASTGITWGPDVSRTSTSCQSLTVEVIGGATMRLLLRLRPLICSSTIFASPGRGT